MLQAHLRGLLKPGYGNGVSSVIREELILQAIQQEGEGRSLLANAQMTSSMLSSMNDNSRARVVREAVDNLRMGSALLKLEPYARIVRSVKAHSVDANLAAFRLLEKTDVFNMLGRILEKEGPKKRP